MLIGITSDTHDNGRPILRSVDVFNQWGIDLLIHCGDWDMPFTLRWYKELKCPILSVLGNGDSDINKFRWINEKQDINLDIKFDSHFLDLNFDDRRIAVCHGDSEPLLNVLIETQLFDVICHGHNHESGIKVIGKTMIINPGTLIGVHLPKTKEHPYTVAFYDTKKHCSKIVEIFDNSVLQSSENYLFQDSK